MLTSSLGYIRTGRSAVDDPRQLNGRPHSCRHNARKSRTWYNADYVSQTRDQERFTISEAAADWHELMIPQCILRPIARVTEQLDPQFATSRHTTAKSATLGLHLVARKLLLISHSRRVGGWVCLSIQWVCFGLGCVLMARGEIRSATWKLRVRYFDRQTTCTFLRATAVPAGTAESAYKLSQFCLSVCMSVCHDPVRIQGQVTWSEIETPGLHHTIAYIVSSFLRGNLVQPGEGIPLERRHQRGYPPLRNHNKHCWRAFQWYQHRWPWTTLNPQNRGF